MGEIPCRCYSLYLHAFLILNGFCSSCQVGHTPLNDQVIATIHGLRDGDAMIESPDMLHPDCWMLTLIFCFLQGCIEDNEEVEEYSDIADILDEYDKEDGYGTEASNLEKEEKPVSWSHSNNFLWCWKDLERDRQRGRGWRFKGWSTLWIESWRSVTSALLVIYSSCYQRLLRNYQTSKSKALTLNMFPKLKVCWIIDFGLGTHIIRCHQSGPQYYECWGSKPHPQREFGYLPWKLV